MSTIKGHSIKGVKENTANKKTIVVKGMPGWTAEFNRQYNKNPRFDGVAVFINDGKKWVAGIYANGSLFYKGPQDTFLADTQQTVDPTSTDSIKQAMRYIYLKMQTPASTTSDTKDELARLDEKENVSEHKIGDVVYLKGTDYYAKLEQMGWYIFQKGIREHIGVLFTVNVINHNLRFYRDKQHRYGMWDVTATIPNVDIKNALRYVYLNRQKQNVEDSKKMDLDTNTYLGLSDEEPKYLLPKQIFKPKELEGWHAVGMLTLRQQENYNGSSSWVYAYLYDPNDAEIGWLKLDGTITYSLRDKKGQQQSKFKLPRNLDGVKNALQYLYLISQKPNSEEIVTSEAITEDKESRWREATEEWIEDNVDKLFSHYLPGVSPDVVFSEFGLKNKGHYIVDSDDEVFIEICFGDQYKNALEKVDTNYDAFVRYAEWLGSTADYDVYVLSNDEYRSITFVFS